MAEANLRRSVVLQTCHVCAEEKTELRKLPCGQTLCLECLANILKTPTGKGKKRTHPKCPFCKSELNRKAEEYEVYIVEQTLKEELTDLETQLSPYSNVEYQDWVTVRCQAGGDCPKTVDFYCGGCHLFICFQCATKGKCGDGSVLHRQIEYLEQLNVSKAKFADWKLHKKKEIDDASKQKVAQLKRKLEQLATEESTLESSVLKNIAEEKEASDMNDEVEIRVRCEQAIEKLHEKEFILAVEKLLKVGTATGSKKTTLGRCDVINTVCCYCVTESSTGEILVGRDSGFDILDCDGNQMTSVKTNPGSITSIQCYGDRVYTLWASPGTGVEREVIVFDTKEYSIQQRWRVPDSSMITNLAVAKDQVYVADPEGEQICYYSIDHSQSFLEKIGLLAFGYTSIPMYDSIKHAKLVTPVYMNVSLDQNVIVSDPKGNKIHRLVCGKISEDYEEMLPNLASPFQVQQPAALCSDEKGSTWVWSKASNVLQIICQTSGHLLEVIEHGEFDEIAKGSVVGMCIPKRGQHLWLAAHTKGLLRFEIIQ